jgi:hypothetical protein
MSMTRNFSLGLLGVFVAVMLASPQAATQTAQQGEARDSAIRRCIAEAHRQYPGEGASRRICSVQTCTRPAWLMPAFSRKAGRVCNKAIPCGVLLSFLSLFSREAER